MPKSADPALPASIDAGVVVGRFYGRLHSTAGIASPAITLPASDFAINNFREGQRFRATVRSVRVRRSRKAVIVLEAI